MQPSFFRRDLLGTNLRTIVLLRRKGDLFCFRTTLAARKAVRKPFSAAMPVRRVVRIYEPYKCLMDAGGDGGRGTSHPRFGLKRQGIGNDEAYARNDLFKNFEY